MAKQFAAPSYLERSFRCRSGVAVAWVFWERTGETRIARISTKLKPQRTHGTQRGTPEGGRSIETSHFQRSHLARMPLPVDEDETLNSFPINLLDAEGVMFETHHFTALVLQPQLGIGNEALDRALRPLRLVLPSKHRAKVSWTSLSFRKSNLHAMKRNRLQKRQDGPNSIWPASG